MPMPPCEPVFQVIESGRDGENLEKLSMETTVRNPYYRIHVTFNETSLAKVNLGRPPLTELQPEWDLYNVLNYITITSYHGVISIASIA